MRIAKKFYMAAAAFVIAAGAFVALNGTGSQAVSSFRNCNDDAIIRCGAITESELLQKYDQNVGDVKAIYSHYGITRDLLAGTAQGVTIKHGTVYQDGRVVVDGKTVATGAFSVSRIRFTSAGVPRNVVINGKTYYEGPSMAIFTGPVDAFVYMKDGVFHKAVLSSCGNPLIATPEKEKPVYKCDSLTATKLERARFRFTAAATARNGAAIAHYVFDFGDGNTKTQNSNVVEHTYANPGTYTVKVKVNISISGQRQYIESENCVVVIKVEKEPVFACDKLEATKLSRTQYRFTAAATARDGAAIAHYVFDFGDGNTKTQNSNVVEHTYAAPGNYTTKVRVNISIGGERQYVTSENCEVKIKVDEEPKVPVTRCDKLEAQKVERTRFTFTSTATAEHAEIVNYTYNFGDGNSTTSGATVSHTYTNPGTYTATVTVNFRVNGQIVSKTGPNCKVTVEVDEEPKVPVTRCDKLEAQRINRTRFTFTATATAENANIVHYTYDFGDGTTERGGRVVTHDYTEPGTYNASVTVTFFVNGQTVAKTGPNCKVTVTVEEEPETPVFKCDRLTAQLITTKERTVGYTLSYTAEGGAELTRVVYNFGDGTSETFTPANAINVEHQYAQPGTYTTTTTLYFNVEETGEVVEKTATCSAKITIPKEVVPCPTNPSLPKDDPRCEPCPTNPNLPKDDPKCAPCPTNPNLPKDDPKCVPCPTDPKLPADSDKCVETPPELPQTGLDMFIGGSIGLGSITAAGYYWTASRRNLLDALLNKK